MIALREFGQSSLLLPQPETASEEKTLGVRIEYSKESFQARAAVSGSAELETQGLPVTKLAVAKRGRGPIPAPVS